MAGMRVNRRFKPQEWGAPVENRPETQLGSERKGLQVRRGELQGLDGRKFRLGGPAKVRTWCLSWEP